MTRTITDPAETELIRMSERAKYSDAFDGCPLWCQHQDECSEHIWHGPSPDLTHEGPVTTVRSSRVGGVHTEMRLHGSEVPGDYPLLCTVQLNVRDTSGYDAVTTWLDPDEAVSLAAALLTMAQQARRDTLRGVTS